MPPAVAVWKGNRHVCVQDGEGVNCWRNWMLLLYGGKHMLWVELQPVWRIHWQLCVFTLQQMCGCVCLCLFLQGHLPQLPVKDISRPGCLDKDSSWRTVSSLWRTEEWTLTGYVQGGRKLLGKEIIRAENRTKGVTFNGMMKREVCVTWDKWEGLK